MNIKILHPIKEELVTHTFPFGSRCYGTATEKSDHDYLKIVSYDSGDTVLQYQGTIFDYIYTDIAHFYRDIRIGKSTINFEVLHLPEFRNIFHGLDNKWDVLKPFYSTVMAKAYIGLAKRDLDYPERLFHINRCIYIHDKIVKKEFLELSEIKNIIIEKDIEVLRNEVKKRRDALSEKK